MENSPAEKRPPRGRVLIVDDSVRNVDILKKILGKDYELATAGSGEEALAVAPYFRPDLVLLDIMMPGIDGYETCCRMRKDASLRWVKIIMVSAKAMVAERLQGYRVGADDYLTKPFDDDELAAKVRLQLRLRSLEEIDYLKGTLLSLLGDAGRTPLNAVIEGAACLMSDDPLPTEERRRLAATVHRGAQRLQRFLDRVLLLAAVKAGRVDLGLEPVDLGALVREAASDVVSEAVARGVSVEPTPGGPRTALLDRRLIQLALTELLEHAIRSSPEHGTVTVTVDGSGPSVGFTVAGEGPDIPPDDGTDGQGLGLAIARHIVLAHHGQLSERREPGSAVLRVELPIDPRPCLGS